MGIILNGKTTAEYGSTVRSQTLAGATLRFYAYETKEPPPRAKWAFFPLPDSLGQELAQAKVDDAGNYAADLGDYSGTLLVVVDVTRFSYAPDTQRRAQGVLGVASPQRRGDVENAATALVLDIALPQVPYCAILKALDLYLIAGRVLTPSGASVSGVRVDARDTDIYQDDDLGGAATDGTGSFEIFCPGANTRVLPALTGIWSRIAPVELFPGPDLYFRVTTPGGGNLLEEQRNQGRTPGRENVDYCSYTVLTVRDATTPEVEAGPTLWRQIGNYLVVESAPGSGIDFDADDLVKVGKYAMGGSIKLKGAVRRKWINGEAVRYRFLVKEVLATGSGDEPLPPAPPSFVVDPDPAPPTGWTALSAEITAYPYGRFESWSEVVPGVLTFISRAAVPTPSTNGWIDVDQRALATNEVFNPTDVLAEVNTALLVPSVGGALAEPRRFAIAFQVQLRTAVPAQQPTHTIHICNDVAALQLSLPAAGSGCDPFASVAGTITVTANYSVAHPYCDSYSLIVQRWDGVGQRTMVSRSYTTAAPGPSPQVLWTNVGGESGTATEAAYPVTPCSYEVVLSPTIRVTNGESGAWYSPSQRYAFCVR